MVIPGRKFSSGGYRYGFNGKENDNEVKGEGNQQDYGFRIYDPRIGKFLSVDPLSGQYAFYSPYHFAGNKPIWAVDVDGLEPVETSTSEKPKLLGGVFVSSSPKKQRALKYISDHMPTINHTWQGNISAEIFANQLKERVLDPYGMNQGGKSPSGGGGTNFCWIAAATSYQFEKNPTGMAALLIDLISGGEGSMGNIAVNITQDLRDAVASNTFDNDAGLAGKYADQLLFLGIAENMHGYINYITFNTKYDLGDENTTWASGTFEKFNRLMRALGNDIVTSVGNDVMGSGFRLDTKVILDAQTAGQSIFLCLYSAHFKNPPPDNNTQNLDFGSVSPIGSHYIQVRNVSQTGNQITMDYWDYGGWKKHTLSVKQLQNCTFGILTTK